MGCRSVITITALCLVINGDLGKTFLALLVLAPSLAAAEVVCDGMAAIAEARAKAESRRIAREKAEAKRKEQQVDYFDFEDGDPGR